MSDRELLELAAKAACIDMDWHWEAGKAISCINPHPEDEALSGLAVWPKWNPLTDDGDALRLAVKLNLLGAHSDGHAIGAAGMIDADPYAATRRAITRAAAEVGRSMP